MGGVSYEALIEQLPDLRRDLNRLRTKKAEIDARVAHLEGIVEGIEGLRGPDEESPGLELPGLSEESERPARLRGIAAVRQVMSERDQVWSAKEIHSVLESRGWLSPDAKHPLRGTEAAINWLWHAGEITKVSSGRYRFPKPNKD